jgi:hypothetical protein
VTEKKAKAIIDPATCSHPLLSRHIDTDKGGFTGDWVCQRCKAEFKAVIPDVWSTTSVTSDPLRSAVFVNMTAWPYCFKGAEGIDDDD